MSIEIVPYAAGHEEAVRAFNARLASAHLDHNRYSSHFPESHVPAWLPRRAGCDLYQEFFVAVDERSMVHGGYILKHQPFLLNGNALDLVALQLPISEGIADRDFAIVGVRLYRDALQRHPRLWVLGGGGLQVPLGQFLLSAGWQATQVPFMFRVIHPRTFLRNIQFLRTTPLRRILLDFLGNSGLGEMGLKAVHGIQGRHHRPSRVSCEIVSEFAEWTDDLWHRCKHDYSLIAVRDRQVSNVLYPATRRQFIRLKITKDHQIVGWAVLLNTLMSGHKQFGDMRVGTLVDCLAKPEDAQAVVACAREVLEAGGSDLIISNQMSHVWRKALRSSGFLEGPSNLPLFASPKLAKVFQPLAQSAQSFHLNRGDGDGPINL